MINKDINHCSLCILYNYNVYMTRGESTEKLGGFSLPPKILSPGYFRNPLKGVPEYSGDSRHSFIPLLSGNPLRNLWNSEPREEKKTQLGSL